MMKIFLLLLIGLVCISFTEQIKRRGIGPECRNKEIPSTCSLGKGKNGVCSMDCYRPPRTEADFCCHIKYNHTISVYLCCDIPLKGGRGAFGGVKTERNEFPYMVALGWVSETIPFEYDYLCGGVLISSKFVLTAGHCASNDGQEPNIVLPGGVSLLDNSSFRYTIEKVYEHPNYDSDYVYNDLALAKLVSEYPSLSGAIIEIWTQSNFGNTNFTAIGYGETDTSGLKSNDLLKIFIQFVSNADCQKYFEPNDNMPQGIIETQICAKDSKQIMDTCQGDSGGPLIMYTTTNGRRKPFLVGITSFGTSCNLSPPGVYTRVSSFINWIKEIIK